MSLTAAHPNSHPESRLCPKCRLDCLRRSHRHGPLDHLLSTFGAQIQRCHSCRSRQAWFQFAWFAPFAIRLADNAGKPSRWSGAVLLGGGFVACLGFLWWMITRFTDPSG
jgi:hypothetical protein